MRPETEARIRNVQKFGKNAPAVLRAGRPRFSAFTSSVALGEDRRGTVDGGHEIEAWHLLQRQLPTQLTTVSEQDLGVRRGDGRRRHSFAWIAVSACIGCSGSSRRARSTRNRTSTTCGRSVGCRWRSAVIPAVPAAGLVRARGGWCHTTARSSRSSLPPATGRTMFVGQSLAGVDHGGADPARVVDHGRRPARSATTPKRCAAKPNSSSSGASERCRSSSTST